MSEAFVLVNENGDETGTASREDCHGNPELIHKVVHLLVQNSSGDIFLQKRAQNKDIQPGKWDTSVGGHVQYGENETEALARETQEELGVRPADPEQLYVYVWRTDVETEYVTTFCMVHEGPFYLQEEEIDEGRFWSREEIARSLDSGVFTPNFVYEYSQFLLVQNKKD